MPEIVLQPKQSKMLRLITDHPAVVIGVGGGRGAAKSSGADRCVITLMHEKPILACYVMRNFDQVFKYHIEAIRRDFPWLDANLKTSSPANLKIGKAQLDFSYAENMDDIIRRFRSGNYDLIIVDQAEQFSWREISEIRKATRSKILKAAKIVLLFNMRGAGIQDLRKRFHLHEYNKDEDPNDYVFLKVNPWDNVEWVRQALKEDGYSVKEYYSWSDEQRKDYAAKRGPYTKQLATDDEVIRKADWEGDWDSLEGAYFANSFDQDTLRVSQSVVQKCMKPWATFWMAQDWGRSHFAVTYWCLRVTLSPQEVMETLGWERKTPLNLTVTYREVICNDMESTDVARRLIDSTPETERPRLKAYYLSPDAFSVRDDLNTIAIQQGRELHPAGMPRPIEADNDRLGGWSLMSKQMMATKRRGIDPEGKEYPEAWIVSSNCPELLNSIPIAMRDPKNLDDVMKTDKGSAKIEQDCLDAIRYAMKSMLSPRRKTATEEHHEKMSKAGAEERMLMEFKFQQRKVVTKYPKSGPSWRGNVR